MVGSRAIPVALLLALTLQSVGQLCVLCGVRIIARMEARSIVSSTVPEGHCRTFVFDPANGKTSQPIILWLEDDEFTCNGTMYDVLQQVDSAGVRVIVAIPDGADTWWQRAIAKEQERQSKRQTQSGPMHDLLAKVASCKAVPVAATASLDLSVMMLQIVPEPVEPERSGFAMPLDRPPLMS